MVSKGEKGECGEKERGFYFIIIRLDLTQEILAETGTVGRIKRLFR